MVKERFISSPVLYISLIGLFLGLFLIDKQSLWLDEYTSIQVAEQSLKKIITGKAFDNHTPPFYYVLLHFWIKLGKNEFILRSFSVIFGVISACLIYFLGRMLFDRKIAILSAFLTIISPFHIYYMQEGRMYTLFLALSIATVICFIKIIETKKLMYYILFFITSVAGLYTHYYYAFLLISLNLAYLHKYLKNKDGLKLKHWFLLQFLIVMTFLPWFPVIFKISQSGGQKRKFLFSVIPYTFFRFNAGYAIFPLNISSKEDFIGSIIAHIWEILWIYLFYGILFIFGLKRLAKERLDSNILLYWLFLPPLISLVLSLKIHILSERYLTLSFPAYILLISYAIISIKKPLLKKIFFGICCIIFLVGLWQYYFNPEFGKEQWRDVAGYIVENAQKDDIILLDAHFVAPLFCHYYGRCGENVEGIRSMESLDHLKLPRYIHRIWLIQSHSDLDEKIVDALNKKYSFINKKVFPYEMGIKVYQYKTLK